MIKKEVTIKGITYQVSSSTDGGCEEAIRMLKRSLKRIKKQEDEDEQV